MAEQRRLERLTSQDLLMLWADDFGWSEDIGVLAVLDGTRLLERDGRVRVEEVRRRLAPRLALVPRFRQLLAAWAQLGRRRLNPSRPLWAAWLLPGLPDHRVGLFVRAHHTMADGVAGIAPGPSGRDAARLGGGVA